LRPIGIGRHAEGNLEHGLGQAIGTQRDADQGQVVAAGNALGVYGEHRQDQEQPEHAQAKIDASEAPARISSRLIASGVGESMDSFLELGV
jgi:hypothetical protein